MRVRRERANIYRARMAYLVIIRQRTSCVKVLKITTHGPPPRHHSFSHCGDRLVAVSAIAQPAVPTKEWS